MRSSITSMQVFRVMYSIFWSHGYRYVPQLQLTSFLSMATAINQSPNIVDTFARDAFQTGPRRWMIPYVIWPQQCSMHCPLGWKTDSSVFWNKNDWGPSWGYPRWSSEKCPSPRLPWETFLSTIVVLGVKGPRALRTQVVKIYKYGNARMRGFEECIQLEHSFNGKRTVSISGFYLQHEEEDLNRFVSTCCSLSNTFQEASTCYLVGTSVIKHGAWLSCRSIVPEASGRHHVDVYDLWRLPPGSAWSSNSGSIMQRINIETEIKKGFMSHFLLLPIAHDRLRSLEIHRGTG